MNVSDARKAHKILDDLLKGNIVLDEEREFLRSALPELPKQKTLEEIHEEVYEKWLNVEGDLWDSDNWGTVEEFLGDLQYQLKDLIDAKPTEPAPTNTPALPAGMRLADHKEFGRVVATDWIDSDNEHFCVFRSDKLGYGTYAFIPKNSLTFIDAEPAHPEFLETEEDYANAPEGTVVACDNSPAWHKFGSEWVSIITYANQCENFMAGTHRFVLRWGWGND